MTFRAKEFSYCLPKELIVQKPVIPRDHCRLLVLQKKDGKILHKYFYQIGGFLKSGDVLVLNDSKVIPARLWGYTLIDTKIDANTHTKKHKILGRKMKVLLLRPKTSNIWECLLGGKRRREGLELKFKGGLVGEILKQKENGIWEIKFNIKGKKLEGKIHKVGETPTPPYIKQKAKLKDYQTIYARNEGSVAAPTAGLHFTKSLMSQLKGKGIQLEFITLHVGLGTFAPVKEENIQNHKMHSEYAILKKDTASRLNKAKSQGRRIIAVGTTSARVLEAAVSGKQSAIKPLSNWIDLFIYPGYKFQFIDGLITNFHLPMSTLLMLVCAFAGKDFIFKAYFKAINKKYRFYSFGDAMLIL